MADNPPAPSSSQVTLAFLFAIFVASFGSGFQYGYNISVLNAPYERISDWIGNSTFKDDNLEDAQRKVTIIFSIIVSIYCIGGLVGALLITVTLSHLGLKWAIISTNIFAFIAAACMGFAEMANTFILLIAGRFFVGINAGIGAGLVPVYLTTVSPVSVRGAIATCYQLFITIGILVSQIAGLNMLLGNEHWPWLFVIIAIVALFQCIFFPFCPDSPEYLYGKGKTKEARDALVWLRGTNDVDEELKDVANKTAEENAEGTVSLKHMFSMPEYRKPLIISCMVMLAQQFSGINAVMYYSTSTFDAANLKHLSEYGTVIVGVVNVIMTIISVFIVDLLGRKALLIFSFAAMAVDTLLFFGTFLLAVNMKIHWASYACIFFMVMFVIVYAIAAGPIPWFIISELFAHGARGNAVSLVVIVHWISNFIIGLTFPMVQNLLGPYVFLIFFVLQVLFLIYIIVAVPETKGKTIEEITGLFQTS